MSSLIVSEKELTLTDSNILNVNQLRLLLKHTPKKYVKQRPAKGGGQWDYVSGGYVKKVLNLMFGWDWDFEILEQMILHDEAIVKGKLTIRTGGKTIIKTQFGNKDVIYKKADANGVRTPLSIGNDLKSAATDSLKKCAAEIGIAADIYNKEEFQSIEVEIDKPLSLEEQRKIIQKITTIDDLNLFWDSLDETMQVSLLNEYKDVSDKIKK